ncbi:MAG: thioredoxin domain-containing protein [Elusimicrobiota bacterium]|jgi:protein-disulfide isomerase
MNSRSGLLVLALLSFGASVQAAGLSKEELKKALSDNPDIVLDVLRQNKKAFFEVVTQAAQEEQGRRQKEEEDKQRKEMEDAIKNPLQPAVADKTRVRGNRKAKYTLIEYSDFQCPYCSRGYNTVETLRKKYGEDLRVVFKHLPLPFHDKAMPAAQWMEAISLQSPEKAWAFHDKMFENQDKLGEQFFKDTAKGLGLDMSRLDKDAASSAVKEKIEADMKEAKDFGFTGTPGFLLNGIPVRGAYPPDYFDGLIQKIEASKKP